MGKKKAVEEQFEQIAAEAREGYSLRDRLQGRTRVSKTVTVYTDEVAGRELGGAVDQEDQFGIKLGRRRWGLKGELDALEERLVALDKQESPDEDEVNEVVALIEKTKKKIPGVLKRLEASALVFTLSSVPDLVKKDARRRAKKAAGIKGKGIEGREEEFGEEYTPILLSESVQSWEDRATGKTFSTLSVEEAKWLQQDLPEGEFPKLDAAMIDLSFQAQISNVATDSADF